MILDFSTSADGIKHLFALGVGEERCLDLNVNFADAEKQVEGYPVRERHERVFIDIRKPVADCAENDVEKLIASASKARNDGRFAAFDFMPLQKHHGYDDNE